MSKLLATVSAIGFVALIALPGAASASEPAGTSMKNSNLIEVSSARRIHHRQYARHSYGHRYYGRSYATPYNAYAYDPYYRPYYRPGVSVGVGPFGFGFGF